MGRIVRIAVPGFAFLSLAGCVSAQELRQHDEAVCASYGFQPGSADFAKCLQRENLARRYGYVGWPHYWW
jgi:hypothetical protein